MTFAISAPSGVGAGSGAGVGSGTARRCGVSSGALDGASSSSSGTGSGRGWRRGRRRERAMAAPPSRRASRFLPTRSVLAFPVVEPLSDARDELEADEVDLLRARVEAHLGGLARPVHEERHARVAA